MRRAAFAVGVAVLAIQVALVAYEHLGATRYFAWAPNDYVVQYRLAATVDGHRLSPPALHRRYHLAPYGIWYFPAQHIMDDVEQYERTYGSSDRARVTLVYWLTAMPGCAATTPPVPRCGGPSASGGGQR